MMTERNDFSCSGRRFKLTFMKSNYLQVCGRLPNGEPIISGIEANLLNSLAKTINFTYDLHETKFPYFGRMLPNNTWTGAVGHISSKKADFALSGLSVTKERRSVVDFSVPYIMDTLNVFVGVKDVSTKPRLFFLSPFQFNVWIAVLAGAILVLMLVYFFSGAEIKSVDIQKIKQPSSLIVISWVMTCTILTVYYGNALKASASVSSEQSINSLDDLASLLGLGTMKFVIPEHHSFINNIAKMPSKPYGDIFRRVSEIRPLTPTDYADIYARRRTTARARLRMELTLLKNGYPPSKIRAVGEPLLAMNTAIAFRKNFTCQGQFNWVIMALWESGCFQIWLDKIRFPVKMQELMVKDSAAVVNYIRLTDLRSTLELSFFSYIICILIIIFQLSKSC